MPTAIQTIVACEFALQGDRSLLVSVGVPPNEGPVAINRRMWAAQDRLTPSEQSRLSDHDRLVLEHVKRRNRAAISVAVTPQPLFCLADLCGAK